MIVNGQSGEQSLATVPNNGQRLFLSLRYDRVILDTDYEALAFRSLTSESDSALCLTLIFFMGYAFYKWRSN